MPQHIHDCTACRFIGSLGTSDLYTCGRAGDITYIVRFSSDGPDYSSHPDFRDKVKLQIMSELGGGDDLLYSRLTLLRLCGTAVTNLMKL